MLLFKKKNLKILVARSVQILNSKRGIEELGSIIGETSIVTQPEGESQLVGLERVACYGRGNSFAQVRLGVPVKPTHNTKVGDSNIRQS